MCMKTEEQYGIDHPQSTHWSWCPSFDALVPNDLSYSALNRQVNALIGNITNLIPCATFPKHKSVNRSNLFRGNTAPRILSFAVRARGTPGRGCRKDTLYLTHTNSAKHTHTLLNANTHTHTLPHTHTAVHTYMHRVCSLGRPGLNHLYHNYRPASNVWFDIISQNGRGTTDKTNMFLSGWTNTWLKPVLLWCVSTYSLATLLEEVIWGLAIYRLLQFPAHLHMQISSWLNILDDACLLMGYPIDAILSAG